MATRDPKRTELSIFNSKPTCLEQHTVVHYESKVKRKVSEQNFLPFLWQLSIINRLKLKQSPTNAGWRTIARVVTSFSLVVGMADFHDFYIS